MTVERGVRLMAGVMILLSVALAHYLSLYWLWLTAFVGFNLLQSSFTNFCTLEVILKKLGFCASCRKDGKSGENCCSK